METVTLVTAPTGVAGETTKMGPVLRGTIDGKGAGGILALLDDLRASGKLTVTSSGYGWNVTFSGGRILDASGSGGAGEGAARVIATVARLLDLTEGSFSWLAEKIDPSGEVDSFEVSTVVPAALDRRTRLNELRRGLPEAGERLSIAPDLEAATATLSRAAWRILAHIDGHRTIDEIVTSIDGDDLDVLRGLGELLAAGLVAAGDPEKREASLQLPPLPPPPPPPAPLEASGAAPSEEDTFDVVFICTGNRFRSPLAEALFRAHTEGLPVVASSFGLQDLGPIPPLPQAVQFANTLGFDIGGHRARPLVRADLSSRDLVVAFERTHLARAVVDAKAPFNATFLLVELVELLEELDLPPTDLDGLAAARWAIGQAAQCRAPMNRSSLRDEIADPLGGSASDFRLAAQRVNDLTERLAAALFGRVRAERIGRQV